MPETGAIFNLNGSTMDGVRFRLATLGFEPFAGESAYA